MRLIDADALKDFYGKWADNHTEFLKPEVDRFIDCQPTIEVESVRHGQLKYQHVNSHHIPSSCKVICMGCGYEKSRVDGEIIRYCQYCGAKMDL